MAFTLRQIYEGVLVEMNKVQAPSLLLEDFNYFANKAVNLYVNKLYTFYDMNLQKTDDLRVLKATAKIPMTRTTKYGDNFKGEVTGENSLFGATYEGYLPEDYLHLLNCICNFKCCKYYKCYNPGTYIQFAATRLEADMWGQIINNFYMKPSYKKPYYYIHNVNVNEHVPTNPAFSDPVLVTTEEFVLVDLDNETPDPNEIYYILQFDLLGGGGPTYVLYNDNGANGHIYNGTWPTSSTIINGTHVRYTFYKKVTRVVSLQPGLELDGGTDMNDYPYRVNPSPNADPVNQSGNFNLPRTFKLNGGSEVSLIELPTAHRLPNTSKVRIEIRYGKDNSLFELQNIYVDYIKAPQYLLLTQELIDLTEDTSQMMEFPDYVCQEIINELTNLIMENSSNPRILTHMPVTTSIAPPAQALASNG